MVGSNDGAEYFKCKGSLLIYMIGGQRPAVPGVGAGGTCLATFSVAYHLLFPSPR